MESITKPKHSVSMLLVEDEKATLDVLTIVFAKKYSNVSLHTASNGRAGLELFKVHLPDIVITDVNMPEMCGVQMAAEIRTIKPDTKLILITGDTGKLVLQDSIGKGFEIDHYILKPVSFQQLFAAIEHCIGEFGQHGITPYRISGQLELEI